MWSPTHVHVIVQKAQNLIIKGKNGTNNAFVVIELGKDTYRTSIKENAEKSVTWCEECELKIPKAGNTACLVLTAYHRNSLGLDQFLGRVKIPLVSFDKFHRSTVWYKLVGKPGKEKGGDKIRGELEVEIGFVSRIQSQSLISLKSKDKSAEQLSGSLFGLRYSDRRMKKFANTLGRAVLRKKQQIVEEPNNQITNGNNLDPGVISDEEEDTSHKSSESLSEQPPPKPKRTLKNPQISISQWEDDNKNKLSSFLNISQDSMSSTGSKKSNRLGDRQRRLADRRLSSSCVDFSLLISPKPQKKFSSSLNLEKSQEPTRLSRLARKLRGLPNVEKKELRRTIVGCESGEKLEDLVPKSEFKNKNKEELINMVMDLQKKVNCISVRVKDLEEYLDNILVKVMENVPTILEKS